ncbi:unnamed protein product [Closterium sp. NIES-64]|nr:unnamed protein product [Closterium sp. NIES-64]
MASPGVLTFDAEGRAVDFEVWVDDLQLFLQCDRADGLSLFDLTSGASPAPAADADATVRSQWATRDAASSPWVFSLPPLALCCLCCCGRPRWFRVGRRCVCPERETPHRQGQGGARALEEVEGAVEVVVEAVEGVGVVVGVVLGVAAAAAALEAAEAVEVVEGAEAAEVVDEAEVEEAADAAEAAAAAEAAVVERQQQQRSGVTLSPQQLREWYTARQRGGGFGPCSYVLRTGDRTGEQCGGPHSTQRCFGRLTDAWRRQFPEASEIPRCGDLAKAGVAIFDLDFDAILAAMYAVADSVEGACYLCVPPDPGIEAAALGAGETAALGASASAAPGASACAAPGAGESALSGTTSAQAFHTFTLDSGASRSFFETAPLLRRSVGRLQSP